MYSGIGLWLRNRQVEAGRSEVQSLGTTLESLKPAWAMWDFTFENNLVWIKQV